jgi:hypothetical protein
VKNDKATGKVIGRVGELFLEFKKCFAECKIAFAECLRHSAKNAIPVVIIRRIRDKLKVNKSVHVY